MCKKFFPKAKSKNYEEYLETLEKIGKIGTADFLKKLHKNEIPIDVVAHISQEDKSGHFSAFIDLAKSYLCVVEFYESRINSYIALGLSGLAIIISIANLFIMLYRN